MANWAGVAATLGALVRPSTLQPRITVPSIAHLDWHRLRSLAKVDGVIIDKDNCIARPGDDHLAPSDSLHAAWHTLVHAFGPANVLVVSNSAGTLAKDPLLLQAQATSRNLAVPVLVHPSPKPARACARQIAAHFATSAHARLRVRDGARADAAVVGQVVYSPLARALAAERSQAAPAELQTTGTPPRPLRLLVIGDRLATDMILAHRLSSLPLSPSPSSFARFPLLARIFSRARRAERGDERRIEAIPVLTTQLWAREGAGTTLLRGVERAALWGLARRRKRVNRAGDEVDWEQFVIGGARAQRDEVAAAEGGESLSAAPAAPPSSPTPTPPPPPRPPLLTRLPSPSDALASARAFPSRLSTLPTRLSSALSTLPTRLSSTVSSLPARLSRLPSLALRTLLPPLSSLLHRTATYLAHPTSAPNRLVRIYTRPEELAPLPTGAIPRRDGGGARGVQERWGERVERAWERGVGWVEGVRGRVRARTGRREGARE
ncbi:phosphatidylglycerophosphatase [Rhodotorula paludigena]|uniref:phosphatidylglycerophosphatase n=1 Tax=Rhodotorula paludigena TaxID=86838 RepID=UPI003177FBF8